MEKVPNRTCITCSRMRFETGEQGYSETTPGCAWSANCERGHWVMIGTDVSEDEYRENLLTAETCKDYAEWKRRR